MTDLVQATRVTHVYAEPHLFQDGAWARLDNGLEIELPGDELLRAARYPWASTAWASSPIAIAEHILGFGRG